MRYLEFDVQMKKSKNWFSVHYIVSIHNPKFLGFVCGGAFAYRSPSMIQIILFHYLIQIILFHYLIQIILFHYLVRIILFHYLLRIILFHCFRLWELEHCDMVFTKFYYWRFRICARTRDLFFTLSSLKRLYYFREEEGCIHSENLF